MTGYLRGFSNLGLHLAPPSLGLHLPASAPRGGNEDFEGNLEKCGRWLWAEEEPLDWVWCGKQPTVTSVSWVFGGHSGAQGLRLHMVWKAAQL